jgi:hypothetical protein
MDWSQRPQGTFRILTFLGVVAVSLAVWAWLREPVDQLRPDTRTTVVRQTFAPWPPGCTPAPGVHLGGEAGRQVLCLARAQPGSSVRAVARADNG